MEKLRLFAFLAALSAFTSPAIAVTFEQAIGIYQDQQFEQAQQAFKELARLGNTKAQLNVAVMYIRGEFFEKDLAQAYAWAALASENGDEAAVGVLGAISKSISSADKNRAAELLEQLKTHYGERATAARLKPTFTDHQGTVKSARTLFSKQPDYPKSMARNAQSGWVDIEFTVGKDGSTRYFKVLTSPHKYFTEAALEAIRGSRFEPAQFETKNVLSMNHSYRYIFRMAEMKVKADEFEVFLAQQKEKAVNGSADAKFAYAFQLGGLKSALGDIKGADGIEWDNSRDWYFKAAQDGSALAKYKLGASMLSGDQCDVAVDKSLFWLEEAAKDNVLDAKLTLGYEYLAGIRFKQNIEKGFSLILASATDTMDHARVLAAWLLSTYPDEKYRDYKRAAELLSEVNEKFYTDSRSFWEAQIATALGQGDWRAAEKLSNKLTKYNKKYNQSPIRAVALEQALQNKRSYIEQL